MKRPRGYFHEVFFCIYVTAFASHVCYEFLINIPAFTLYAFADFKHYNFAVPTARYVIYHVLVCVFTMVFFCEEYTFATVFGFIFCSGSNRVINETTAAFAYRNALFFIYRYDGILVVYTFIVCRYRAGCCSIACLGCDFYGLFNLEVVEDVICNSELTV